MTCHHPAADAAKLNTPLMAEASYGPAPTAFPTLTDGGESITRKPLPAWTLGIAINNRALTQSNRNRQQAATYRATHARLADELAGGEG